MFGNAFRSLMLLSVAALCASVVVASPDPAEAASALSPACTALNDPQLDGMYEYDWVSGEFYPFEEIVVEAGPPDTVGDPVGMYLDISTEVDEIGPMPYPGTIRYVVPEGDHVDVSVWWSVKPSLFPGPEVTWSVSCHRTPSGYISGTVSFDIGDLDPMYTELLYDRVEVYSEDGDLVGEYVPEWWGDYATDWMPEGWYYVLMYNGNDDGYIDFFPQWYPDTPLYQVDTSNLIHVYDGEVPDISGVLQLGFIDMWDSVFLNDITWMQMSGITKGCGDYKYCTNTPVTRGQMAAFLVRALGLTDDGGGNLFIDDDTSIFERDIDRLATAGITRGCNPPDNTRFCPDDPVTRGQMAAFLVRAMGYTWDGGGDLFIDDQGSTFEGDIDRLAAAGVTRGCNPPDNTRFCPDDPVTRGQMAAFLHRALGDVLYPADATSGNPMGRALTQTR